MDVECGSLSLDSFLIKPFQRITKYPLLLRVIDSVSSERRKHKHNKD